MANLDKILASTFQITVKTNCITMPDSYVILLFMQQQCLPAAVNCTTD